MKNNKLVISSILVLGILTLIFTAFPKLDLVVSGYFYDSQAGFIYRDNIVVKFFYYIIPITTKLFAFFCFISIVIIYSKTKNLKTIYKSAAFFLLISAVTGPALIVNSGLKDHFGRARPRQIVEFNGSKKFTPAFIITDQCNKNCSFSSGHAAMAFYFSALAYVLRNLYFTRSYILGIILGIAVGFSRIIMGGHFASDVITSGFIILLINHLLFLYWKKINENQ